MSFVKCPGFEAHFFRPNKCKHCFTLKSMHATAEQKKRPPVPPRPPRRISHPHLFVNDPVPKPVAPIAEDNEDVVFVVPGAGAGAGAGAAPVVVAAPAPVVVAAPAPVVVAAPAPVVPAPAPVVAAPAPDESIPAAIAALKVDDTEEEEEEFHSPIGLDKDESPSEQLQAPPPQQQPVPNTTTGLLNKTAFTGAIGTGTLTTGSLTKLTENEQRETGILNAIPQQSAKDDCCDVKTAFLVDRFARRGSAQAVGSDGKYEALPTDRVGSITLTEMRDYNEDYTLIKLLGQGGYGQVYLAKSKFPDANGVCQEVAIKLLKKSRLLDKQSQDELRGEISILHHIKGTSSLFLNLIDVYETPAEVAILTEVCNGDMIQLLTKCNTEAIAAAWFLQVMKAVEALHGNGIIHRDLKPDNFLIGLDGNLRCCDFGLAVPARDLGLRGAFKEPGQAKGTIFFVPPEAFRNEFSVFSDIWACGVILHVLLCGVYPFKDMNQIISSTPLNEGYLNASGVSEEGKSLVKLMLNKNAQTRPIAAEVLRHTWITQHTGNQTPQADVLLRRFKTYGEMDHLKKAMMKIVSLGLQPNEIVHAGRMFESIDTDGSRTITADEMKKVFIGMRGAVAEQVDEIISSMDVDGNAVIDYDEFITASMCNSILTSTDLLKDAFRRMDLNGDGVLSRGEIRSGFRAVKLLEKMTDEEIDEFIRRADKDGNGEIDMDEFIYVMQMV